MSRIIILLILFINSQFSPVFSLNSYTGKSLPSVPKNYVVTHAAIALVKNKIREIEADDFIKYRQEVTAIHLQKNLIHHISPQALEGIKLRTLNLNNNRMECLPDLTSVKNYLTIFFIGNNLLHKCTDANLNYSGFTKLRSLDIKSNKLSLLPPFILQQQLLSYLTKTISKLSQTYSHILTTLTHQVSWLLGILSCVRWPILG